MNSNTSGAINTLKFLSLIGVVMIHSNPMEFIGNSAGYSTEITFNVISAFLGLCVPFFFILAGFLFFFNIDKLNTDVILSKWRSRIRSLVIPYFIWNIVFAIVRIVKALYAGTDCDGIVVNGHIFVFELLKGFWDTGSGYPLAFAFWFVRNLIVFVALSPIVYFIARRWWLAIAFMCLPALGIHCYGMEYFMFGAALGMHRVELTDTVKNHLIIYICIWIVALVSSQLYLREAMSIVRYIGFLLMICAIERFDVRYPRIAKKIDNNSNVFFFIYAVHGLYCTNICKVYTILIKPGNTLMALLCFIIAFATILGLSYLILLVVRAFAPRVLNVLCGGRLLKK